MPPGLLKSKSWQAEKFSDDLQFLADRSRLYDSVASFCLSTVVCTECIVSKRCVLEQKLLLHPFRRQLKTFLFIDSPSANFGHSNIALFCT